MEYMYKYRSRTNDRVYVVNTMKFNKFIPPFKHNSIYIASKQFKTSMVLNATITQPSTIR